MRQRATNNPNGILKRGKSVVSIQTASRGNTEAIRGERTITPIENIPQSRRNWKKINGPGPPDASHRMTIYIRAANLRTIRQQEAEIVPQFYFIQLKSRAHPIGLQWRDVKTAPAQRPLPKRHPSPANPTRIVVENPAHWLLAL